MPKHTTTITTTTTTAAALSVLHKQSLPAGNSVDNDVVINALAGEFTSLKLDVSSLKDGMSSLKDEVSSLKDAVYSLKDEVDALKDMMRIAPMRVTNYSLTTHDAVFWPSGIILPPGSPTTKNEISHASETALRAVLQALGQHVAPGAGREAMQITLCDYLGVKM